MVVVVVGGAAVNAAWQGNLSAFYRFTSPGLGLGNSLFPSGLETIIFYLFFLSHVC
jgi:hypothetical protein